MNISINIPYLLPFVITASTAILIEYIIPWLLSLTYFQMSVSPLRKLLYHCIDNSGHGIIASVTWLMIRYVYHKERFMVLFITELRSLNWNNQLLSSLSIYNVVFSGVIACLLDLDHFLIANTFTLEDALNLNRRPFGHSITFIIVICTILYSLQYIVLWYIQPSSTSSLSILPIATNTTPPNSYTVILCTVLSYLWILVFTAWFTHQLRDSIRRGLWFYPIGTTSSIPFSIYSIIIGCIPYIMEKILQYHNYQYPGLMNNVYITNDNNLVKYINKENDL